MTLIRLVYMGDHFHSESKSIMSSIYTDDGRRYDWGFVERDLAEGQEIRIRQATAEERVEAERQLRALKRLQAVAPAPAEVAEAAP